MTPFLPGATDHHFVNALRFCPTTSSTSGMSASGHGPVAPSGPEAMLTLCMTSAKTRTFADGIVAPCGPVSSWDQEYDVSVSAAFAVLACRTTIWNPSYSFRAANSAAEVAAGRESDGRTFLGPSATRTVAARETAGATTETNVQAVNHRIARMQRLPTEALGRNPRDSAGRPSALCACDRALVWLSSKQGQGGLV